METSLTARQLSSPEECVALLKFRVVGMAMAAGSFGVISIMACLVWRVLES
jgi:hypothetical protein